MTMSSTIKIILGTTLTVSMAACSYRSTPKNEHQGAVETKVTDSEATTSDISQIDLNPAYASLQKIQNSNGTEKTQESRKVIEILKSTVLNPAVFENPKFANEEKTKLALEYYNFALTALIEEGSAS